MDVMVAADRSEANRCLASLAGIRRPIGFASLLLLTAALLCRPAETVPGLLGLPLYAACLVACLATNLPEIRNWLSASSPARQPIAVCLAGILPAAILSQAVSGSMSAAWDAGAQLAKVLSLYLLLVAVLDSPSRMRVYVCFVSVCTVLLASMALVHHHELVRIPGLHTYERWRLDGVTGEMVPFRRLVGAGVFANPNDMCLLLAAVLPLTVCQMGNNHWGGWLWIVPLGLFGYAIALTQSRGGFLALLVGAVVLLLARIGWRRGTLLAAVVVPICFLLFQGRQTELDLSRSTGQQRIRLWDQGFHFLAESPLFGIGYGEYGDRAGLVAHNSFIHCYAELGLVGGTLFLGAFFLALGMLSRLVRRGDEIRDPELRRTLPYLLAAMSAYAAGLLTLSRVYVEPTYLMLGMATAYLDLGTADAPPSNVRPLRTLVGSLVAASAAFLMITYTLIQFFIRP